MEAREDQIRDILAGILEKTKEDIPLTAKLTDDLGADSLHKMEFIMALESAFGITIPETEAQKIDCVKDAIAYIGANHPRL
jgi:acyl carrier protein